ncbi:hypothetical protein [Desulfovibrio sp. ZJ369]|uniref:hypothetical protein n=1 Tax=Desulfovibrio sp. ZJ369 TaxID=2709793 RepID=UPI0013EDF757|nr:hypothetical protein [Desulfovibrio sp. ZJ369]
MRKYRVHYIAGPNENLTISRQQIIEAASFQEALGRVTAWPVVETYDHASACAHNPGISLYDFEAWEAVPLEEYEA